MVNVHTGQLPKPPGHVRFVCISDTHNNTDRLLVPEGDVLLHSGDFTKSGWPNQVSHFNNFLSQLNHPFKVVIAGNHDLCFDSENFETLKRGFGLDRRISSEDTKKVLKDCIYLEDSGVELFGYKIWGSPWSPTFFNWAFNLDRGEPIAQKWSLIPKDTQILLTHGPHLGYLDKTYHGTNVGCEDLLTTVQEIKPIVHLFGHIHEGYGVLNDQTTFINASTCNLSYKPLNPPLVFDLPNLST